MAKVHVYVIVFLNGLKATAIADLRLWRQVILAKLMRRATA